MLSVSRLSFVVVYDYALFADVVEVFFAPGNADPFRLPSSHQDVNPNVTHYEQPRVCNIFTLRLSRDLNSSAVKRDST